MGISASIEVANQLTQFAEGGRTLSDVLRDPEILASWESKYGALPKEAQKYFSKKRRSTEQEQLLSTIKNIQSSHLGISKYFRPSFDSWKKPDGFSVRGFANCEDPLARIYLELKGIADRRASDPIRERIYAVSLYKLYTSLARSAQGKLEPHKEGMIQRICDSSFCCDSRENVSQWIEKYWGFGRKMDAIAQENGGYGALMVIPAPLLTPSSWHKKVSDAILEEVNAHFISIEVDKVARSVGAHQVAERILQFISASFNHPDAMTQRSLLFNGANVAPPYQVTTESPLTYAVNPAHQWDGNAAIQTSEGGTPQIGDYSSDVPPPSSHSQPGRAGGQRTEPNQDQTQMSPAHSFSVPYDPTHSLNISDYFNPISDTQSPEINISGYFSSTTDDAPQGGDLSQRFYQTPYVLHQQPTNIFAYQGF